MKKHLHLIFMLFASALTAQTHNELIWKYANDHIGQKVGNGNCSELVKYAYKTICSCKLSKRVGLNRYYYRYGREIPKDSVIEGDLIVFDYVNKKTKKPVNGHIGIVYSVSETNMSIANQNYAVKNKRYSTVDIVVYSDITDIDPAYTQTITFYRPF